MSWLRDIAERIERQHYAHHSHAAEQFNAILERLNHLEHTIMASKQDVLDSIAALGTDWDAEFKAISDKIGSLSNAGGASSADLDDLKSAVEAMRTKVQTETGSLGTDAGGEPTGG